jgi:hypothetical protein
MRRADGGRTILLITSNEHYGAIIDADQWAASGREAQVRRLPATRKLELGPHRSPVTFLPFTKSSAQTIPLISDPNCKPDTERKVPHCPLSTVLSLYPTEESGLSPR